MKSIVLLAIIAVSLAHHSTSTLTRSTVVSWLSGDTGSQSLTAIATNAQNIGISITLNIKYQRVSKGVYQFDSTLTSVSVPSTVLSTSFATADQPFAWTYQTDEYIAKATVLCKRDAIKKAKCGDPASNSVFIQDTFINYAVTLASPNGPQAYTAGHANATIHCYRNLSATKDRTCFAENVAVNPKLFADATTSRSADITTTVTNRRGKPWSITFYCQQNAGAKVTCVVTSFAKVKASRLATSSQSTLFTQPNVLPAQYKAINYHGIAEVDGIAHHEDVSLKVANNQGRLSLTVAKLPVQLEKSCPNAMRWTMQVNGFLRAKATIACSREGEASCKCSQVSRFAIFQPIAKLSITGLQSTDTSVDGALNLSLICFESVVASEKKYCDVASAGSNGDLPNGAEMTFETNVELEENRYALELKCKEHPTTKAITCPRTKARVEA